MSFSAEERLRIQMYEGDDKDLILEAGNGMGGGHYVRDGDEFLTAYAKALHMSRRAFVYLLRNAPGTLEPSWHESMTPAELREIGEVEDADEPDEPLSKGAIRKIFGAPTDAYYDWQGFSSPAGRLHLPDQPVVQIIKARLVSPKEVEAEISDGEEFGVAVFRGDGSFAEQVAAGNIDVNDSVVLNLYMVRQRGETICVVMDCELDDVLNEKVGDPVMCEAASLPPF